MNDFIKLADFIRKGAGYHKPGMGAIFTLQQGEWETCAVGAALEGAVGHALSDEEILAFKCGPMELTEIPIDMYEDRPELGGRSLYSHVASLNDDWGFSREEVARELERIGGLVK